jgi:hypothetical protein
MSQPGRILATLGHNDVCMKAKMNRYYLSLWDVGKPSLYVEKEKASKFRGRRFADNGQGAAPDADSVVTIRRCLILANHSSQTTIL